MEYTVTFRSRHRHRQRPVRNPSRRSKRGGKQRPSSDEEQDSPTLTSSQPSTSQDGRGRDRRGMPPDNPVGDRRPLPAKRARLDSGTGCGWRSGNPERNRVDRSMSLFVSMDESPGRQEQSRGSAAPKKWSDVAGGLVAAESTRMCAPSSESRYTTYSKVSVSVAPATPAVSAAGTASDAQASWGTVCRCRALSSAAEGASRAV